MRKLWISLGVVLLWAPAAQAQQHRAAVLPVEGGLGRDARAAITRGVSDLVALTSDDDVDAAVQSAGTAPRDVANRLHVELLVVGEVNGRGRHATTGIRIVDAAGTELARGHGPSPSGRNGRRVSDAAGAAMREAIAALGRQATMQAATAVEERPPGMGGSAEHADEGSGDDSGDASGEQGDEDGDEGEGDDEASTNGARVLRLMVGGGIRTRNTSVSLAGGSSRTYSAGGYGDVALRLELRPFAKSSGALRGLMLVADGGYAPGLTSSVTGGTTDIKTTFYRVAASLGWMASLASGRVGLGALVGGGMDGYRIDPNPVLASATYSYLRPAIAASFALVDDLLRIELEVAVRIGLGVGSIGTAFGSSGSAWAFDGVFGLAGGKGPIAYGLRLGYTRYSLSFSGVGTDAQGTGGHDSAFTATALVGLQL